MKFGLFIPFDQRPQIPTGYSLRSPWMLSTVESLFLYFMLYFKRSSSTMIFCFPLFILEIQKSVLKYFAKILLTSGTLFTRVICLRESD